VLAENYAAVLWKHGRLILGCAIVFGMAMLIITFLVTPTYEAEADVAMVKTSIDLNFDSRIKTVSESDVSQAAIDQTARRKALATIAGSPDLASIVIARLGGQLSDAERVPANLVRAINARGDGDMIRISARAGSAEKAALLANTWAQLYTTRINEIYSDSPLSTSEVQTQADDAKRAYTQAEAALVGYMADNPASQLSRALEEKQQVLTDSLAMNNKLDRLLADARSLRDRLTASPSSNGLGSELARLSLEANSFGSASSLPALVQSGTSSSSAPVTLQLQVEQLKLDTTPAQQLSDLDALLAALTTRRALVQSNDVARLQQEINQLQASFEQEDSKRHELTRARDLAWTTYTTLSNKVAEVAVAEQIKGNVVRLAVAASLPQDPVEPRRTLYTALAIAAGLIFGMALAFWREYATSNAPERAQRGAQTDSELAVSRIVGD
jgi:capsular polysaccharide biosynthesis protein